MIKKSEEKKETKEKINYEVKVTRAAEVKEGSYAFDMVCNGINVYGMFLNQGENESGGEFSFINFPSQKGKDGKFYNFCWFPISNELQTEIENQIGGLL